MSTRFFENQESARRNTSQLVVLFGLAVIAIVAMLYALAVVVAAAQAADPNLPEPALILEWWQPDLLVMVVLATMAVVASGSLYKILQLRGGGEVVAEALGGTLIASDTSDPNQRRLLNVVEEMAIASGTPIPPVYMMNDESGINAFAAGFSPGDAVVGVTRGTVEQLSRDELQGVIAHEFSHILSGDMRLNIKLMGVVHGILIIGMIGYFLMRSSMFSHGRRNNRDNSGMALLAIGIGLMLIGFLGTFFGNWIKASVSRQREFLADASSVQFTRNPDGIADALKKIAGFEPGSLLESPNAPESSHLFFGQGVRGPLQLMFATHPPLDERIRRIDPSWQGEGTLAPGSAAAAPSPAGVAGFASSESSAALPAAPDGSALDQIGEPTLAHIDYAAALVRDLPAALAAAVHEPYSARAVIYALLINPHAEAREAQFTQLASFGEAGIAGETERLLAEAESLEPRFRLPLVDMTLPALRALSKPQYRAFASNVRALVEADRQIELFEWTLQRTLLAHLHPHFERVKPPRVRHRGLAKLDGPCSVVLSVLALAGSPDETSVDAAFEAGAGQLPGVDVKRIAPEHCGLRELELALAKLVEVDAPSIRPLLAACAACIAADRTVTQAEGELMRAIADAFGCPMPPLLPGQPLA